LSYRLLFYLKGVVILTVTTLIASILSKMPHSLVNQDIVDFFNDVESQLYTDTVKEFISTYIPLIASQAQYSFPTGTTILDIESVFLRGVELPKRDLRQKNWRGYYKEGDKLTVSPVPSTSDTVYVSGAGEITFAATTITTTGDDFTGAKVGDIILVSGAATAANNKYATATGAAAKVLTFPADTWSAGLDAGAVTVSVPSLEVVSRYKPTAKLLANITTDTLLLPDAFIDIYRYYAYAQICFLREQFDRGDNWVRLYNSRMSDYKIWYENNRPKQHIPFKRRW
jgi:hypothetical protein